MSFPDKSENELQRIEGEFYRNLCDYAVETLKLLTIPKEELSRRMVYRDFHLVNEYKAKKQSVLILASHTFNWEWLLSVGTIYLPVDVDFIFQKQNSAFFNTFSLLTRTRFGAHPIERQEVAKENFKRRNLIRAIAMVADQYPGHGSDKRHHTTFLNRETVFFLGGNQFAHLMQCPVLYAKTRKIKRGFYETVLVELTNPPYEKESTVVVDNYIRAVEKSIHENPSLWLWSHNRWKTRHLE